MEVREGDSGGDALREMCRKEECERIHKELKETVTKSVSVTDWPLCCVTNSPQIQWLPHSTVLRALPSESKAVLALVGLIL